MSKVEQALKSAIQFIESTVVLTDSQNRVTQDTLAQCKAALAELEKCEPVAYKHEIYMNNKWVETWYDDIKNPSLDTVITPLYTAPQRPQPLKRLGADKIGFIFRKEMTLFEFYNALMDATEELNHEH